jgi:hypothetical protein
MTRWPTDFQTEYQKFGTDIMLQPLSNVLDYWMWLALNAYYTPYVIIGKGDEMDQFISHFSLNGIKSNLANLCKPN